MNIIVWTSLLCLVALFYDFLLFHSIHTLLYVYLWLCLSVGNAAFVSPLIWFTQQHIDHILTFHSSAYDRVDRNLKSTKATNTRTHTHTSPQPATTLVDQTTTTTTLTITQEEEGFQVF